MTPPQQTDRGIPEGSACSLRGGHQLRCGVPPVRPSRFVASDRATGITRALGPGCAGSSGRSHLRPVCGGAGSGPPCSPRDHSRGKAGLGSCSIRHSASAAFALRSGGGVNCLCLTLPVALAGVGLGVADRSQPRAGPDSSRAPHAGLGPVSGDRSPPACHDVPPAGGPRPAATYGSAQHGGPRTGGMTKGGEGGETGRVDTRLGSTVPAPRGCATMTELLGWYLRARESPAPGW